MKFGVFTPICKFLVLIWSRDPVSVLDNFVNVWKNFIINELSATRSACDQVSGRDFIRFHTNVIWDSSSTRVIFHIILNWQLRWLRLCFEADGSFSFFDNWMRPLALHHRAAFLWLQQRNVVAWKFYIILWWNYHRGIRASHWRCQVVHMGSHASSGSHKRRCFAASGAASRFAHQLGHVHVMLCFYGYSFTSFHS
jgi:hypothetical protein